MHAWSRRFSRLVGALLVAAVAAGAPWPSSSTDGTEEATTEAEAPAGYRRGMQLFLSERYAEAHPYFVDAREEAATHYGRESREYATALNNLAELYRLMERYDEAEPLFLEALAIEEARLGAEDPGLARPLNNLALMYRAQGRYDEAERNLKRSLAILEDTLGRRHPDVAGSLNNLARLYETMGMNERAQPLLERSLMIAEDMLGPAHPATQQISNNLARVSAALAAALADASEAEAIAVADATETEVVPAVGPPAELVLPEAAATETATAAPSTEAPAGLIPTPEAMPVAPVVRSPEPELQVADAEPMPEVDIAGPEPAAGPEPIATIGEAPVAAAVAPEALAAAHEEAIEEPAVTTEEPAVTTEEPAVTTEEPAVTTEEPAVTTEEEVALVLPLPETRPSGRRWAKLPAGRYAIHLASVRSPISASEEWERLRGVLELPGDIGQLEPARIEVADQGVFYRVLGGPFASQAEAIAACRPIRAKGDYCAVLGTGD